MGTLTGHDAWNSTHKLSLILAVSPLCSSSCELCQHHPLPPSISIHPCCLASISAIFLTFQWFVLAEVEQDPTGDVLWHNTSIPPDALLVFALIPPLLSSSPFSDNSFCKTGHERDEVEISCENSQILLATYLSERLRILETYIVCGMTCCISRTSSRKWENERVAFTDCCTAQACLAQTQGTVTVIFSMSKNFIHRTRLCFIYLAFSACMQLSIFSVWASRRHTLKRVTFNKAFSTVFCGRHLISSWFMLVFLTYCCFFLFFASYPISLKLILKYHLDGYYCNTTDKRGKWISLPGGWHDTIWGDVNDVSGGWGGLAGGWGTDWPICEGLNLVHTRT